MISINILAINQAAEFTDRSNVFLWYRFRLQAIRQLREIVFREKCNYFAEKDNYGQSDQQEKGSPTKQPASHK